MRTLRALVLAVAAAASSQAVALDLLEAWRAARSADTDFGVAQAAALAGQARKDQAAALWRPDMGLSATAGLGLGETSTSGARFSAPGFGQSTGVAFDTSVQAGGLARVAVTARQPLVNGERKAEGAQLEAGARAAALDEAVAAQALAARVAAAYLDLAVATRTLEVLQRQQVAVSRAREEIDERFRQGEVPVTDTHEAAARVEGVRAQILAAENDIAFKRTVLADMTGLPAARLDPVAPAADVLFENLPGLEAVLAAAAAGSPALQVREAALGIARLEVDKRAPGAGTSFDLVAQLGHERLSGHGEFGHATSAMTNGLVGVQLSIPLDTSGMRSARRQEAVRLVDKAEAELRQARQQLAQAVRGAWLNVAAGRGRQAALAAALKANAARLDATRLGQQVGDRTTLDLFNAEADYSAAELALLRTRADMLAERVRLAALSGQVDEAFVASLDAALKGGNRR